MYVWLEEMTPVQTIIRTGRGLMMAWTTIPTWIGVSASAAFYPG